MNTLATSTINYCVPFSHTIKVEVFKTNVQLRQQAMALIQLLSRVFPGHHINFDLEDCDKILRIEGPHISIGKVCSLLQENGFMCEVLEG